jgi:hypothetical protein
MELLSNEDRSYVEKLLATEYATQVQVKHGMYAELRYRLALLIGVGGEAFIFRCAFELVSFSDPAFFSRRFSLLETPRCISFPSHISL